MLTRAHKDSVNLSMFVFPFKNTMAFSCQSAHKGAETTGFPKTWHKRQPAPESYSTLPPAWETEATGFMGFFQPSQRCARYPG